MAEDLVALRLIVRDEFSRALNQMSRSAREFDQSVNFSHATTQFNAVTRAAQHFGREIGTVFKLMGAASVVSGGGVVASLALMANSLRNFAQSGQRLYQTSDALGINATELARMSKGVEAAGASADEAMRSIEQLGQAITGMSRKGQEHPIWEELFKMPGGQQFGRELIETFRTQGMGAAQEFFASHIRQLIAEGKREGADTLLQIFGNLSRALPEGLKFAKQLHDVIVPNKEQLDKFSISWVKLEGSVKNVGATIGNAFLPSFEKLFKKLDDWLNNDPAGKEFLKRIEGWGLQLSEELEKFTKGEGELRKTWEYLKQTVKDLKEEFKAANEVVKALGGWKVVLEGLVAIGLATWLGGVILKLEALALFFTRHPVLLALLASGTLALWAKQRATSTADREPGRPQFSIGDIRRAVTGEEEEQGVGPELRRRWRRGGWRGIFEGIYGEQDRLKRDVGPSSLFPGGAQKFADVQLGQQDEKFIDFLQDLKVNMDDFLANAPLSENIEDRRMEHRQKDDLRDNFRTLNDELLRLNNILIPPETQATPTENVTGQQDPYGSGTIKRPAGGPGTEFPEDIRGAGIKPAFFSDAQLKAAIATFFPGGRLLSPLASGLRFGERAAVPKIGEEADPATVFEHMQKYQGMARAVPPPASLPAMIGSAGIEQQIRSLRGQTVETVAGVPQIEGTALGFAAGPSREGPRITGMDDPYGSGTINRPSGMEMEFNPFANRPLGFAGFGEAGIGKGGGLIGRGAISPGFPVGPRQGKASWFGNFPESLGSKVPGGWYDPGDIYTSGPKKGQPLPNWAGYPQSTPGVAIPFAGAAGPAGGFAGMPVRVTDLTRTSSGVSQLARAVDLGPSQHLPVSREKAIDINAALAERQGYAPTARQARLTGRPEFPTGGQFRYQVISPEMFLRTRTEMMQEQMRAGGRPLPFTRHPGAGAEGQASLAPLLAQENRARSMEGNAAVDINVTGTRGGSGDEARNLFRENNLERAAQMDPIGGNGNWNEDSGINYE